MINFFNFYFFLEIFYILKFMEFFWVFGGFFCQIEKKNRPTMIHPDRSLTHLFQPVRVVSAVCPIQIKSEFFSFRPLKPIPSHPCSTVTRDPERFHADRSTQCLFQYSSATMQKVYFNLLITILHLHKCCCLLLWLVGQLTVIFILSVRLEICLNCPSWPRPIWRADTVRESLGT
jgi:hypothetical protein